MTLEQRLAVERRFLAAYFLCPRDVDIEQRDFVAPEHGLLYDVMREVEETWPTPAPPLSCHVYDPCALVLVREFVRLRAAERNPTGAVSIAEWAERYVADELMREQVTPHALTDLVELVRACPRCGR